jgi:phospholipid/cholesterol/gamma-HCH transport system substrate-binding protein
MKVSKEVKVGLFMISAIVLLYFGFNFLKGIDFFSSDKKYYAIYRNVDELTESNLVLLNGLAVGRVSDLQIQQHKNRVIVELSIDSEIQVYENSVAVLNGKILGGKFIQLVIGNSDKLLENKDTIRSDFAKGLSDLIQENAQPVAANLQTTLGKVNTLVEGLNVTTLRLNMILEDFGQTPRLLNSTITSVKGNVSELSSSYKDVGTNLNSTLADLKPTLANLRVMSDSLKQIQLAGTVRKLQQTITTLNQTLGKLNSGDNTAGKLLTEDSLYVNLNSMLKNLDSLANHFNENPDHFMAPLGKSKKQIEKERKKGQKD